MTKLKTIGWYLIALLLLLTVVPFNYLFGIHIKSCYIYSDSRANHWFQTTVLRKNCHTAQNVGAGFIYYVDRLYSYRG